MSQKPEHPQAAAARAQNAGLREHVRALADEVAEGLGLYVVDVEVRGQQGSRVIEVFAASDEGAGLDDLAKLSRELEFLLDAEDAVKGRYTLNVSSPGADRPLRLPRQYRHHLGRTLTVTTETPDGPSARTGTLAAVHDDAFELEVDGRTERIAYADVTDARVQLPW